jgi:hypothetical protein
MKVYNFVFILLLLVFGCEKDKSTEPKNTDIYTYSAFDSTGTKVIQGWFEVKVVDPSRIEGSWHLRKLHNVGEFGPQIGDGHLAGYIYNDSISINLNPDFVDNNIILRGPILDYVTKGEWSWVTIAGVSNKGTYKAIRFLPD